MDRGKKSSHIAINRAALVPFGDSRALTFRQGCSCLVFPLRLLSLFAHRSIPNENPKNPENTTSAAPSSLSRNIQYDDVGEPSPASYEEKRILSLQE